MYSHREHKHSCCTWKQKKRVRSNRTRLGRLVHEVCTPLEDFVCILGPCEVPCGCGYRCHKHRWFIHPLIRTSDTLVSQNWCPDGFKWEKLPSNIIFVLKNVWKKTKLFFFTFLFNQFKPCSYSQKAMLIFSSHYLCNFSRRTISVYWLRMPYCALAVS